MKGTKILFIFLALFALSGCGGNKKASVIDTETNSEPESEYVVNIEAGSVEGKINVSSWADIDEIYQFDLEGRHYRLPCELSEFINDGYTSSEFDSNIPQEHTMGQIRIHPNGAEDKYIELTVLNDAEEDRTVEECNKVVGVCVRPDSNVSFTLNSGIIIDFNNDDLVNELIEMYGTDERVFRLTEDSLSYYFYRNVSTEYDGVVMIGWGYNTDSMRIDNDDFSLEYIRKE